MAATVKESRSLQLLGVRVDCVTMKETMSRIESMVESGKEHSVVPVNPELIMQARRNPEFRAAVNKASLVLPDGIGVVLAARLFGKPLKERVTGVDTVRAIAQMSEARGFKIFLLGAGPGVAVQAAAQLRKQFPQLEIAGTSDASPFPEEEERACELIRNRKPHIVLVAYGAPKQELWVSRNLGRLGVPVLMCVGGSFDVIAGNVARSPRWLQAIGCEWLYRLIREPRRWRRMLALPRFAGSIVLARLFGKHDRLVNA